MEFTRYNDSKNKIGTESCYAATQRQSSEVSVQKMRFCDYFP